MVEQRTHNPQVRGSNPCGPTLEMNEVKKINIYGIEIAQTDIQSLIDYLTSFLNHTNDKGYITVTGVHGIIESQKSKIVRNAHQNSLLSIPDGMPLVWYSKIKGSKQIKRCFGPEMMNDFFEKTKKQNFKHFFYGGNPGIAEQLKENFSNKFSANIVGTYCPPFRPLNELEKGELLHLLQKLKPDIIWIGLSTPKQEIFMYENIHNLECRLMFGVGAAFDYHTGNLKIASKFIQNIGLEWLFRLLLEPKRLYKRYFEIIPKFIYLVTMEFCKKILRKS